MIAELGAELVIILAMTLANGFFSGAEIAIVSARRSRLEAHAREGRRAARRALELGENPDRFLATVQVGITLIGTFSAAFGGARIGDILTIWFRGVPALEPYAETLALVLVVVILTYISLIFGELVPKQLALKSAEHLAMVAAPIMSALSKAASPVVDFLTFSVNVVLRLVGQQQAREEEVTQEDIVYMVREGTQTGGVEQGEANLIQQVFHFTDRPVRSVMTPRTSLVAVEAATHPQEAVKTLLAEYHSRVPVYEGTIDNIVGVLHVKDLLRALTEPAAEQNIHSLMRPATIVIETDHIDDVLTRFRRKGIHLAAVVDEYGQTAGIITMEDLLEELIGDIRDEYDHSEDHPFIRREDGSWLVDGMEAYDKVRTRIGLPAPDEDEEGDFTTLAGFIMARLNRVPKEGDSVQSGEFALEVVDMDGMRIDKVLVRLKTP